MKALVGYTGFVGSNLKIQTDFNAHFNSKNIRDAFGLEPELLVYCGVKAEKYMANQNPEADLAHIKDTMANISAIAPKKIVLISTIDVYPEPRDADEFTTPELNAFDKNTYGKHRLMLETYVQEHFDALIVRLPALFGRGLKKNFVYDLSHPVPQKLSASLFKSLSERETVIENAYTLDDATHFYLLNGTYEYVPLLEAFERQHFTSLYFTDSRAVFQFYPLERLWQDIEIALKNHLKIINLATEPVCVSEIHTRIMKKPYHNEKDLNFPQYDLRTRFAAYYHSEKPEVKIKKDDFPYLMSKEAVLDSIEAFLRGGR